MTNDFSLKIQINTVWWVIFEGLYFCTLQRILLLQKLNSLKLTLTSIVDMYYNDTTILFYLKIQNLKGKSTTQGIPRWSPTKVLTLPNTA